MDSAAQLKSLVVKEVPAGTTAVLNCDSNDFDHNFMFWLFDQNQNVSPQESGYYKCISKKLDGTGLLVGEVEMLVKGSAFTATDAVKLVAILVSIIVIVGCAVLYYRLRKEWRRYDGRVALPEDDDAEADEIYNPTTTTISQQQASQHQASQHQASQPVAGPSRNLSSEHLLFGIDNQGLDTDFNSVFENIQIKSPNRSLI
ncbi:Matrix-remodeling-associated protein 5 [Operophtera brumata]|uniref:Matrix-remodeling-associated protein 5 n=1 Tax=Operophtera brumata TaxID=104452 RepID=A0A0L7KTB6_OPEBR|nr:Matrix-remodeling-associated protein 5 [Operophtera brumata]